MRPFGLLLAACVCTVLLYDRLSGRFPRVQAAAAKSSPAAETRLEKLQHCLAVSQLLEIDLSRYRQLRTAQLDDMVTAVQADFRILLGREQQGTWDRLLDEDLFKKWKSEHSDNYAAWVKEFNDRDMLQRHYKLYREAIADPRTEAARAWRQKFEKFPLENEMRVYESRILMFQHEREAALAALK
jgi:hypothetical protein